MKSESKKRQFKRLALQQEIGGGPISIFGQEAQKHDINIRSVSQEVFDNLKKKNPHLEFRFRNSLAKKDINQKLASIDERLGQVLFVKNSSIKPDGGIIEVKDKTGNWRVILVGESKHQGNDIEKIIDGIKQGKNKDSDLMVAGNAIERVHKNIQEFKNYMMDEIYFPYVVFLQGSNFATETVEIKSPDGRTVKISHNAGNINRIDRVTASNYCMEINKNYCKNIFVKCGIGLQMFQVPSLYFQCNAWESTYMFDTLSEIANTSLEVIFPSL